MGEIVAVIDLGTSRTAYSYKVLPKQEGATPEVYLGKKSTDVTAPLRPASFLPRCLYSLRKSLVGEAHLASLSTGWMEQNNMPAEHLFISCAYRNLAHAVFSDEVILLVLNHAGVPDQISVSVV